MTVESTTQTVENIVNTLAPIVAAAVPAAAPAIAGVQAAETVTNAVEANLDHHTAANDVAVGLSALASTPAVQSNPAVAEKVSGIAALFADLLKFLGIEK